MEVTVEKFNPQLTSILLMFSLTESSCVAVGLAGARSWAFLYMTRGCEKLEGGSYDLSSLHA
jgi:hypothetical protein